MSVKNLFTQGLTIKEIADELGISEWSVAHQLETHLWDPNTIVLKQVSPIGYLAGRSSCPVIRFSV